MRHAPHLVEAVQGGEVVLRRCLRLLLRIFFISRTFFIAEISSEVGLYVRVLIFTGYVFLGENLTRQNLSN
jgi:Na+/phosphate symporter